MASSKLREAKVVQITRWPLKSSLNSVITSGLVGSSPQRTTLKSSQPWEATRPTSRHIPRLTLGSCWSVDSAKRCAAAGQPQHPPSSLPARKGARAASSSRPLAVRREAKRSLPEHLRQRRMRITLMTCSMPTLQQTRRRLRPSRRRMRRRRKAKRRQPLLPSLLSSGRSNRGARTPTWRPWRTRFSASKWTVSSGRLNGRRSRLLTAFTR